MKILAVEPTESITMRKNVFIVNNNCHWQFQVNQLSALNTQKGSRFTIQNTSTISVTMKLSDRIKGNNV